MADQFGDASKQCGSMKRHGNVRSLAVAAAAAGIATAGTAFVSSAPTQLNSGSVGIATQPSDELRGQDAAATRAGAVGQGTLGSVSPLAAISAGIALGAVARVSRHSATNPSGARSKRTAQRASDPDKESRFPILTRSPPPKGYYAKLPESVHPGVVTGQALEDLYQWAKENKFAIPAVNCVSTSGINACLEAARKMDAPIMIQFSSGGSQFYAGKGLDNTKFHACVAGAVAGAYHTRAVAEQYGIPVILHTDHCSKDLLPWIDGLMRANESFYEMYKEPLFSSHMLDLSEETLEENISICKEYLERMAKVDCALEMELGITGGEEDGVNNEDANPEDLYSTPEEIWTVYEELSKVPNGRFSVAAAFGNVHGVYSPGNVKLDPEILGKAQTFIKEKLGPDGEEKPVKFVFHGGSGSDVSDIKTAIGYGVIKMNIDTDTQWSYWSGMNGYIDKYRPYMQSQVGNPDGPEKANKKYYDPRTWMRSAETETVKRLGQAFEDLNCVKVLGLGPMSEPQNVLGPRRGGLPV